MLQNTLQEEKELLKTKLAERERQVRCDEVYGKITARPKTKVELEEYVHSGP